MRASYWRRWPTMRGSHENGKSPEQPRRRSARQTHRHRAGARAGGPAPHLRGRSRRAALDRQAALRLRPDDAQARSEARPRLRRAKAQKPPAAGGHLVTALALVPRTASLDSVLALVIDTVSSEETKRHYGHALVEFLDWRAACALPFNRASVQAWRAELEKRGLAPSTINICLSAIRKLAREAAHNGYLDAATAAGIDEVPNVRLSGNRAGNWLTQQQAQALIQAPEPDTVKGKRDRCALSLLVGCGLRRAEAAQLTFEHVGERDGRFCLVDIRGKRGRIRTVPLPGWVKIAIDRWKEAAQLSTGRILRAVNRHGQITRDSISG